MKRTYILMSPSGDVTNRNYRHVPRAHNVQEPTKMLAYVVVFLSGIRQRSTLTHTHTHTLILLSASYFIAYVCFDHGELV